MKKVLWITDDLIIYEDIICKEKFKYYSLDLTLSELFFFEDSFDLVLVDYGHVGDETNAIEVLRKYYLEDIQVIWTGGLGGGDRYQNDCKKMFPKEKWLHKIKSWELRDIEFFVAKELGVNQNEENETNKRNTSKF